MDKIKCLICGKEFKSLVPHLKKHNILINDYKNIFKVYSIVSKETTIKRSISLRGKRSHMKGKTYEELYGKSKADKLKQIRAIQRREQSNKWFSNEDNRKKHSEKIKGLYNKYKFLGLRNPKTLKNAQLKNWVNLPKESTKEIRKKISVSVSKSTWTKFPEKYPGLMKKKIIKTKETFKKHPECLMFNKFKRFENNMSKPQTELYNKIKNVFSHTIPEKRLKIFMNNKYRCMRFLDIYIPEMNVAIEYDGLYTHNNLEKDKLRDKEVLTNTENMSIIHYRNYIPEIEDIIVDILFCKYTNICSLYKEKNGVV
jgi:hypothetical protein